MQSTPTIVVSQSQNINIIASSPQLAGKVWRSLNRLNDENLIEDSFVSDDANKWQPIYKLNIGETDAGGES